MNPLGVHENLLPGGRCDNRSAFPVYFKCSGELELSMKDPIAVIFFTEMIRDSCYCSRKLSPREGRLSKWF